MSAFDRAVSATMKAYQWMRGRRHYPWAASPPHRIFAMIAHRLQGWPGRHYRAVYNAAGGALKFRERVHAQRRHFGYTIAGDVDANVLRHAALWQYAIVAAAGGAKFHVNVHVRSESTQLDRFDALMLASEAIGSIDYFFGDASAADARTHALTVAEEKHGWGVDENGRAADYALTADVCNDPAWRRIFSRRTGFDRNVNQYLKLAHAGARVVAVSLPEDAAGLADRELPAWREAIARFAHPGVHFVLLNRFGPAALSSIGDDLRGAIAFAATGGLSFAEGLFLAQSSDAYVGVVDVFGLAARTARRPGVYVTHEAAAFSDEPNGIVQTADGSPRAVLEKLALVLAVKPGGDARPPSAVAPDTAPARGAPPAAGLHTLVIPTYNRPALLRRLLEYLARRNWQSPVLVLDSSAPDIQDRNRDAARVLPNARHLSFDQTLDPYAKMRDGIDRVDTPYCSLCADDDLIVPATVEQCVRALERDPGAAVAHGLYFNFREAAAFELSYIVYRGASIEDESPIQRLRRLFAAYEAVIYGVYRTAVARRMFRDVHTLDTVLGKELITGAITALAGKCLRVPAFYYGRNTDESLSYSGWHPHQILAQQPERLFTSYPAWRALVLEALHEFDGAPVSASRAQAVDLIMLRYLEAPPEILDFIIDLKLQEREPDEIVRRVWDVYVRNTRPQRPLAPLLQPAGAYSPEALGPGRAHDYVHESHGPHGSKREYRVLYEFLYPDYAPPAAAGKNELLALLGVLDSY